MGQRAVTPEMLVSVKGGDKGSKQAPTYENPPIFLENFFCDIRVLGLNKFPFFYMFILNTLNQIL